jgi:hypothetical protein
MDGLDGGASRNNKKKMHKSPAIVRAGELFVLLPKIMEKKPGISHRVLSFPRWGMGMGKDGLGCGCHLSMPNVHLFIIFPTNSHNVFLLPISDYFSF